MEHYTTERKKRKQNIYGIYTGVGIGHQIPIFIVFHTNECEFSILGEKSYGFGSIYIIFSAVLAHFFLREKLLKMGMLGCVLCVVGSTVIVLHAPSEHSLSSVEEIWVLATQPGKY